VRNGKAKEVFLKKIGRISYQLIRPGRTLILLSISTAYTLLSVSVSMTVEKGNPYKIF
jgi:hypothetical protein